MSENELKNVYELFIKLKELVKLYGCRDYKIQLNIIDSIIDCIESNCSSDYKTKYIVRSYKNLYPPQGGLSDFYIHNDDYEERLRLNKPLDEINDKLWNLIKTYL